MVSEGDIMEKNICILDKTITRRYGKMSIGTLALTPSIIFFIITGNINRELKLGSLAGLRYASGNRSGFGFSFQREFEEGFKNIENNDEFVKKLDILVMEKKGSVKINKCEIKYFTLPSSSLFPFIKIKTNNKKYKFNIMNAIRENRLNEINNFINTNLYIMK